VIGYHFTQPTDVNAYEHVYPGYGWPQSDATSTENLATAADPLTLLIPANVEPTLRAALLGDSGRELFCCVDSSPASVQCLLRYWTDSAVQRQGNLCLVADESNGQGAAAYERICGEQGWRGVRLSQWDRQPVTADTVIIVDQRNWYAAISASVRAIHFATFNRELYWLALAMGRQVSVDAQAEKRCPVTELYQPQVFQGEQEALTNWEHHALTPQTTGQGDSARRAFWAARRQAKALHEKFLQRVFDW
jgi:hypothetical protein